MKVTLARDQRSQKRVIKRELKLEDHRECLENKKYQDHNKSSKYSRIIGEQIKAT